MDERLTVKVGDKVLPFDAGGAVGEVVAVTYGGLRVTVEFGGGWRRDYHPVKIRKVESE